jgi:apolipoprotein N-acyltransferase
VAIAQLHFFFTLFSWSAIALWLVLAFWIGLFAAMARLSLKSFGPWGLLCLPFLWMGMEYFRSELYYLRFSWLTPGFAFASPPCTPVLHTFGVFGLGFLLMSAVCLACAWRLPWLRGGSIAFLMLLLTLLPRLDAGRPASREPSNATGGLVIAGMQMEFPAENLVPGSLRELLQHVPEADLIVLSEYTFDGPVPEATLRWCENNRRYLVVGGKEPVGTSNFFNTAFVVGPN